MEPGRTLLKREFPHAFDRDPIDDTASSQHRSPFQTLKIEHREKADYQVDPGGTGEKCAGQGDQQSTGYQKTDGRGAK